MNKEKTKKGRTLADTDEKGDIDKCIWIDGDLCRRSIRSAVIEWRERKCAP